VPKKATSAKPRPLYRRPPPKPRSAKHRSARTKSTNTQSNAPRSAEFRHPHFLAPSHFTLREDGSIQTHPQMTQKSADSEKKSASISEISGQPPRLIFESDAPFVRLYHGNSLDLLDAIYERYGDAGRFDANFADPPYFLPAGP
jgi:hypothetical protein